MTSLLGAAACGGGGGGNADAPPRIDSRPTIDSPIAATCLMASTYDRDFDDPPDGMIDVLSLGNETTPIDLDGQLIDLDGDGTAETYAVGIIGVLNSLPGEDVIGANHGYQFILIDGVGMFAAPNDFANAPMPNATTLDSGATCGGCLQAWGGWADGAQIDLNTATQVYLADAGTLTLTQFNPGLVGGANSLVVGSYNNISMTGFDPVAQTPLDPPCTTTVTELDFGFNVTWPNLAVAPQHTTVKGIDWSKAPIIPFHRGR